MATYEITSPTGEVFEISAPDGASHEDVVAYAQKSMPQTGGQFGTPENPKLPPGYKPPTMGKEGVLQSAREIGQEQGILGRIGTGIAAGGQRMAHALGLGNTVAEGDLDVTKAAVQGAGPAASAAQMVTEIGGSLFPAFKAAKGVQAVTQAAKFLPKWLSGAGAMAATEGAVSGAITTPEDRTGAALTGATLGPVFQKAGNAMGRVLARPVAQKAEASVMRKAGIPVTLGQGADPSSLTGRAVGQIEEGIAAIPLLGNKVARQREEALAAWRAHQMKGATPKPSEVSAARTPVENMRKTIVPEIDDAYRKSLAGKTIPRRDPQLMQDIAGVVADPKIGASPSSQKKAVTYIQENFFDGYKPGQSAEEVFAMQTALRNRARQVMRTDPDQAKILNSAADQVYKSLGDQFPDIGKALADMKIPFAKYTAYKKAIEKTPGAGEFKPSTLRQVGNKIHPDIVDAARKAEVVFGNKAQGSTKALGIGSLGTLGALGAAYAGEDPKLAAVPALVAILAGNKGIGKVLSGSTTAQRKLAIEMLRGAPVTSGTLAGNIGSRFNRNEEEQ